MRQALSLGERIASALDAAHRKAIVHRDLKPGNIMVTPSGVKLLDFGLAKSLTTRDAVESLTSAPTSAKDVTREGMILGTPSYMAPEQLEGKEADARSDIFAFGAVLYEMVTGKKAFSGKSQASLISAILSGDPPSISTIQPRTPPALERLVRTCLAKDPDERWQSAGDIARELAWIGEGSGAGSAAAASRRPGREWLAWAVAALALVLGVTGLARSRGGTPSGERTRFKILAPPGQNLMPIALLSPDSRRLLLLLRDDGGKNRLAIRPLDSLEFRILPGTEDARGGFWSPDGREIAFFAEGRLKRMSADGGPAQSICESGGAVWGAWSPDGTILFAKEFGGTLQKVPASGGVAGPVGADAAGEFVHQNQPWLLPDGRHFVFLASNPDFTKKQIVLGSLDSRETKVLFPADSSAVYAEPGYLLFGRDDAVLAWRFDARSLRLLGEPFPAFENVHWTVVDNYLSLSAAGSRIAYESWSQRRRLVWVDRKGRELGTLGEVAGYIDVRISPDGRKVAVALRDPSHARNGDIWVLDAARGTGVRITPDPADEFNPAWFPDSERVAYVGDRFGFFIRPSICRWPRK